MGVDLYYFDQNSNSLEPFNTTRPRVIFTPIPEPPPPPPPGDDPYFNAVYEQWTQVDVYLRPGTSVGTVQASTAGEDIGYSSDQSLQAVVNSYSGGTRFGLTAGLYRLVTATPKENMRFIGKPGGSVVVSGARLLPTQIGNSTQGTAGTHWVQDGSLWWIGNQTQEGWWEPPAEPGYNNYHTKTGARRSGRPEDVYVTSGGTVSRLRHVDALGSVGSGDYFFDYSTDRIYIGSNPTTFSQVETGINPTFLTGNGTNTGVHVINIIIEKYASVTQGGALGGRFSLTTSWTVRFCELRWNHAGGTDVNSGWVIEHCYIHSNGQGGVMGNGSTANAGRTFIRNNTIVNNKNIVGYNEDWEGGGLKLKYFWYGCDVVNNHVHDNKGCGIWFDIQNDNCLIASNLVVNNTYYGIFWEISYKVEIRDNRVLGNSFASPWGMSNGAGAGIRIVGNNTPSDNPTIIHRNHVDGPQGIIFNRDNRMVTINCQVNNNDVKCSEPAFLTGATKQGDAPDDIWSGANLTWNGNIYRVSSSATKFRWGANWATHTFSTWQGYAHTSNETRQEQETTGSLPLNAIPYAELHYGLVDSEGTSPPPPPPPPPSNDIEQAWTEVDIFLRPGTAVGTVQASTQENSGYSQDQSLQAVIDSHTTGTQFGFTAGIYRLTTATPQAYMTFTGKPGANATVSGSKTLPLQVGTAAQATAATHWTVDGSLWWIGGQTQQGWVHPDNHMFTKEGQTRAGYPEDVYVTLNSVVSRLRHVDTLAQVGEGDFWFDYPNNRIYIGSDPAQFQMIETSVTEYFLRGLSSGPHYITIQNLIIEKYASLTQGCAVAGRLGYSHSWVVRYCDIRWNHAGGTHVNRGWRLENNRIRYNGSAGVLGNGTAAGATAPVIRDNEIAHNKNIVGYNEDWEGGGLKLAHMADGCDVINNWVHNNYGVGIWFDIDNSHCVIASNLAENNTYYGIFWEISYHVDIRDNQLFGNGYAAPYGEINGSAAGIRIASSSGTSSSPILVRRNHVDGVQGISLAVDSRRQMAHCHILNNDVKGSSTSHLTGGTTQSATPVNDMFAAAANNIWNGNIYRVGATTNAFRWDISFRDWATHTFETWLGFSHTSSESRQELASTGSLPTGATSFAAKHYGLVSSESVPPPQGEKLLLIAESATNLPSGHAALRDLLIANGWDVIVRSWFDAVSYDGVAVVVIVWAPSSDTSRFLHPPIGIVTIDSWRGLGMGTGLGWVGSVTDAEVVNASSPLAAGVTGTFSVYQAPSIITWEPSNFTNMQTVVTRPGQPTQRVVFAYEAGSQMATRFATTRHVNLSYHENGLANLTQQAINQVLAAVQWARATAYVQPPAPDPDPPADPDPDPILGDKFFYTSAQIDIYRHRMAGNGPFYSTGQGFYGAQSNAPGDGVRALNMANGFIANTSASYWQAPLPMSGQLHNGWPGGPNGPTEPHINWLRAAWCYMTLPNHANNNSWRTQVKNLLMWTAQNTAHEFSNNSKYSVNHPGFAPAPIFNLAGWMYRWLKAFDMLGRSQFTSAELTILDRWFYSWANYILKWRHIEGPGSRVPNRLQKNFSSHPYAQYYTQGSGPYRAYDNGPYVSGAYDWNNRVLVCVASAVMIANYLKRFNPNPSTSNITQPTYGWFTVDDMLWRSEVEFWEWNHFSNAPAGFVFDFHRAQLDGPSTQGWTYSANEIANAATIAKAFALRGDYRLVQHGTITGHSTTSGSPNNTSGVSGFPDKNLQYAMWSLVRYVNGSSGWNRTMNGQSLVLSTAYRDVVPAGIVDSLSPGNAVLRSAWTRSGNGFPGYTSSVEHQGLFSSWDGEQGFYMGLMETGGV